MYWGLRQWRSRWPDPGASPSTSSNERSRARSRPRSGRRDKLVWLKTPANPTWAIADIAAAAELAHQAGARLAVDGTAATPVLSRPLRPRRRPGHALGDQIPERPHRPRRRRAGHRPGRRPLGPDRRAPPRRRRDPGALRGLAAAARHAHAVSPGRARLGDRPLPRRAPAGEIQTSQPCSTRACQTRPATPSPRARCRAASAACSRSASRPARPPRSRPPRTVEIWQRATSLGGIESLIEHRASIEGPDFAGAPRPAPPTRSASSTPMICWPTSSRRCTKAPRNHRDRRADRLWWGSADPIKTTRLRSFGGRTERWPAKQASRAEEWQQLLAEPDGRRRWR